MSIQERDESILNFFTPAILLNIGLLLLSVGAVGFILIHFLVPILIPDNVMASVQMNLFGQIVGIIITLIFLFPLFKVKHVETKPPTIMRTLKVLGIACLTLTVATLLSLILWLFFTALGLPIVHSYGGIVLTPMHLANPWNLVLFFSTVILGAAIFEELIFRRMLIPTLETRGMAPTAAVLASSLGFALIHVPNDIINGSIGYVLAHFITSFTTGFILGLVYVFTRNVIFPMIIHGFINLIAFTELILEGLNNFDLLIIFALVLLVLWIIGIIIGVLLLVYYFKTPPPYWVNTFKRKSQINILPGLIGYLIFAFGLVSFQVIGDLAITLFLFLNVVLLYSGLFLFYLVLLLLLLWVVHITQYQEPVDEQLKPRTLYDKASEVTQEPRPE